MGLTTKDVTRVEVIDHNGRSYVAYDVEVEYIQLQDENRTLKVFLRKRDNEKSSSTE